MELRGYIELLRRRWWILLLGPILAGASAYAVSDSMTPTYAATATILVNQTQVPGIVQYNDILTSERLTNTYAELVDRDIVIRTAIERLGLDVSEATLAGKVHVTVVRNTQLLKVTARDPSPQLAASIANGVSQAFIDSNQPEVSQPGTVSIAEQAKAPSSPVSPNIPLNVTLGALLGLIVAAALVALREYLDDTVKSAAEVEALPGLSTMGVIGRLPGRSRGRKSPPTLSVLSAAESAESYRQLRTNIHFAAVAHPLKTILVTSANPREGKSTSVANLAVVLAQAGQRVIVVDTDLRRPQLHTYFRAPNSLGLTGLLLTEADEPDAALVATRIQDLWLLPSGPRPPNPSELLTSPAMARIIEQLSQRADYVLFDSPPILAVTDASILALHTDAAILIAEGGRTRTEALRRAHEALLRANARVLGVVINKAKGHGSSYAYYGHYRLRPEPTPEPGQPRPSLPGD